MTTIASFIFIISAIGVWYHIKKKPNKERRNISIGIAVASLIVVSLTSPKTPEKKVETTQASSSVTKQTDKQEEKISDSSSSDTKTSTKEETSEQSSTTETNSSTQEIKNDGREYDKAANGEFANHFLTELNNLLSENGVQVNVEYYDKTLIYVYLPQDAKYLPTVEIQKIADTILSAKEKIFTDWAIDNGFDLGFTNSPTLYLKAEDGTTLAEENNFNETMTVKVKN